MSNPSLTFFVSQFNSNIDAPSLTKTTTTDYSIMAPNTAVLFVPISQIAGMFQFKTSTLMTTASEMYGSSSTLYRFNYIPGGQFTINLGSATIDKSLSLTSMYVTGGETIGLGYVNYIAHSITGSRNDTVNYFGVSEVSSSINNSVHSKITETFSTITTDNTEGITKSSSKPNPSYRLLEQFGDKLAMNLTPPRFTSELLASANGSFQDIPLKVGDKLIFKVVLTPPSNQRIILNPNTDNTAAIPPMETLLQINLMS